MDQSENDWWDEIATPTPTPAPIVEPPKTDPVVVNVRQQVRAELVESGQLQHDLANGPGDIGAINQFVPGIDLDHVDPHPRSRRAVNDHRPYA
jgi:hypothetical protein